MNNTSSLDQTGVIMSDTDDFDTLMDALKGETILVQPRVSREVLSILVPPCDLFCLMNNVGPDHDICHEGAH